MKQLLISTISFVFSLGISAQMEDVIVAPLNHSDNLPVNEITQIFKDSEGFLWFGTTDGLCRDDGYNIHVFRKNVFNPSVLDVNSVLGITEDNENHIWVGTTNGLIRLNKTTFEMIRVGDEELKKSYVNFLLSSSDGTIWAMGSKHLYHISQNAKIIKKYDMHEGISCLYEDSKHRIFVSRFSYGLMEKPENSDNFIVVGPYFQISTMLEDTIHGCYWLCDNTQGIIKYEEKGKGVPGILTPQGEMLDDYGKPVKLFTHMVQDDRYHYLWAISYFRGLHVFKVENGSLKKVSTKSFLPKNNNIFYSIMKTNNGHIWLTGFDTKSFVINLNKKIIHYNSLNGLSQITNFIPSITSMYRDGEGIYWLMQKRNDLYLYDAKKNNYVNYNSCPGVSNLPLSRTELLVPSHQKNTVWAVTNGTLAFKLHRQGMQIDCTKAIDLVDCDDEVGSISSAYEDKYKNLWIGTAKGIYIYKYKSNKIETVAKSIGKVTDFSERKDGTIWCSVSNKGIVKINKQGKFKLYPLDLDILTLAATSDKIWIGTREGRVYEFNEKADEGDKFSDFTGDCGMNGDMVAKIIADCYDHIWIITNQRVKEYNPSNGAFRRISALDPSTHVTRFLPKSVFVDNKDNKIYIGSVPGFVTVEPTRTMESVAEDISLCITDVYANGNSIWFEKENHKKNNELTIASDVNKVIINFSTLDYEFLPNIRYAYKLEDVDDDWVKVEAGNNAAVYSNLPKGKHKFMVKATDKNGIWSDKIVEITIDKEPAWYETGIAYFIYILLFIGAVVLVFYLYKKHLDEQSKKKLHENISQAKLTYFTSISHELLTPLTIISCLAEQISSTNDDNNNKVNLIQANVVRLRRLLQQVLDFRKVESHNMKLYVEEGNITEFLQSICKESFEPLAKNKNIQFLTLFPVTEIKGFFDHDKLEKILFNLVSNAFKYTQDGKSVTLSAKVQQDDQLCLSVKDEGVGIDQREQKFIFNRFYSSKKNDNSISNGIGLSLTKELVELHHGLINVTSQVNKGSEFTVVIPINKDNFSTEEIKEVRQEEQIQLMNSTKDSIEELTDENKENLLMVEDNLELLSVMQEMLARRYNVFAATNGLEALEVLGKEDINIIVSDISMPKMDGIELCRRVKQNINTSHISFVLLTAKISTEAQVESYNAGADAYLTKPFETKVLLTLLDNLKAQREKRQQEFQTSTNELDTEELHVSDIDQQFIQKAIELVENNLDNPQLDVEFLASGMNVSRSTLSRKLKAISGQTAFEFIKSIRLRYAYRLLKRHTISVTEVMDRVGYIDHHSFSQSFKDLYGILPSEVK